MSTPTPRGLVRMLLGASWLSGVAGTSFATAPQRFQRDVVPENVGATPADIAETNALLPSMADEPKLMSQTKAIATVAFVTRVDERKVAIDDPVSAEISAKVETKVSPSRLNETRPRDRR